MILLKGQMMEFNKGHSIFISVTFYIQVAIREMQSCALSLAAACQHHHTILPCYSLNLWCIEKWQKSTKVHFGVTIYWPDEDCLRAGDPYWPTLCFVLTSFSTQKHFLRLVLSSLLWCLLSFTSTVNHSAGSVDLNMLIIINKSQNLLTL